MTTDVVDWAAQAAITLSDLFWIELRDLPRIQSALVYWIR